jgi:hypothetical protein
VPAPSAPPAARRAVSSGYTQLHDEGAKPLNLKNGGGGGGGGGGEGKRSCFPWTISTTVCSRADDAVQVEIESKDPKAVFQLQALKPSGFNTVSTRNLLPETWQKLQNMSTQKNPSNILCTRVS